MSDDLVVSDLLSRFKLGFKKQLHPDQFKKIVNSPKIKENYNNIETLNLANNIIVIFFRDLIGITYVFDPTGIVATSNLDEKTIVKSLEKFCKNIIIPVINDIDYSISPSATTDSIDNINLDTCLCNGLIDKIKDNLTKNDDVKLISCTLELSTNIDSHSIELRYNNQDDYKNGKLSISGTKENIELIKGILKNDCK